MPHAFRCIFIVMFTILASCTNSPNFEHRLASLESEKNELHLELARAKGKLSALEFRLKMLEGYEGPLDPTEKGYTIVKANNGQFLVSCENIIPYGDGQKIVFRIGNPYSMTFNGFTITARYGRRAPEMPTGVIRKFWDIS